MGNDPSKPISERIILAVKESNTSGLKALLESLPNYPNHDIELLHWTDKDGRTPLILASKKGYVACASLLLRAKADVNYMNRLPESRGTALHEAVHEKEEEVAELLLKHGANPFLANSYGLTALDEAVSVGFTPMIKCFKSMALHQSTVLLKVPKVFGMSTQYKPRLLMIFPYHPFAKTTSTRPPKKQMWILTDEKSVAPKGRIWLDGSSIKSGGEDGAVKLHLHPTHPNPGHDFVTSFDRGFGLFIKVESSNPTTLKRFKELLVVLKESSGAAGAHRKSNNSDLSNMPPAPVSMSPGGSLNGSGALSSSDILHEPLTGNSASSAQGNGAPSASSLQQAAVYQLTP